MKIKTKEKPEKDFYEKVTSVKIDKKADSLYIISESDSLKGIRVTWYDVERGLINEYRCRN